MDLRTHHSGTYLPVLFLVSIFNQRDLQQSPIDFDQTYTRLDGRPISFASKKGDSKAPEWSRVIIGDNVHIIGEREVRFSYAEVPSFIHSPYL
jgi:hypothetical protein